MTKFVRVRDSRTNLEYSVTPADLAKGKEFLTEIKEPAADGMGRALPHSVAKQGDSKPVTVTEPKTATKKES